uniref:Uncharacterized protein n=1 Tax=Tanacetum cinerariifolium TaxID=118510 RepID=A0A6L2K8D2_TANCI|nr:hypothetical protein [Tanacetum cinerariifolium]
MNEEDLFRVIGLSARIVSSDEEGLGDQEDASKQGKIAEIDVDEDLSLIDETTQDQGRMNEEDLFRVNVLDGDEVIVDVTAGENVEQSTKDAKKEEAVFIGITFNQSKTFKKPTRVVVLTRREWKIKLKLGNLCLKYQK